MKNAIARGKRTQRSGGLIRIDADASPGRGALELHLTVHEGEQGVVVTDSDIGAGIKLCAALADQDAARFDDLASKALDAQHLGLRISTVAGGTLSFLMCHLVLSFLPRLP